MPEAIAVSQGVLWVVVLVLAVAVLALARQVGVLSQRVSPVGALMADRGLRPGDPAPQLPPRSPRTRRYPRLWLPGGWLVRCA